MSDKPIRIVVIEDSPVQRQALVELFEEDDDLTVVEAVATGKDGIAAVAKHRPDLVTCDIGLPDMDGFDVVKSVMADNPTPIIMLTATLRPKWRKDAFHALTLGAMDVIEKPELSDLNDREWRKRIQRQLRFIARSPVIPQVLERLRKREAQERRRSTGDTADFTPSDFRAVLKDPHPLKPEKPRAHELELLAVVASAGGPRAIRTLLEGLSGSYPFPAPIIIAQHMGRHMGGSYATFLAQTLETNVVELYDGALFQPGTIYIAPGRRHIEVTTKGRVRLFDELPDARYSPSLDYFLWSVARVYGPRACGVILTGMGDDGADGLLAMRRNGAQTIAQDESSSLVYGMPRVAHERGAAAVQQPISEIPQTLRDWFGART